MHFHSTQQLPTPADNRISPPARPPLLFSQFAVYSVERMVIELSGDYLRAAASVVKEMNTVLHSVNQKQPHAREALLALSDQLTAMLESPSETIQQIGLVGWRYGVCSA